MSKLGNKVVKWVYQGNKTICIIQEPGQDQQPIVVGEVKKYAKDIADKRLGRKLSFSRAMTQAVQNQLISKADRGLIWNDFISKIKQPVAA